MNMAAVLSCCLIDLAVMNRVLDRLKHVDVRTSGRKNFGVQAPFAGRMAYFTVIRPDADCCDWLVVHAGRADWLAAVIMDDAAAF